MKRIRRRLFSAEFENEAIKLVNEQGLTVAEAARRRDLATKSRREWTAQAASVSRLSTAGTMFSRWQFTTKNPWLCTDAPVDRSSKGNP